MTAPAPDGQQARDPFARARGLLEPEARRRGLTVPELLCGLARAGRRHAPPGTGPRGGTLRWALPQTTGDPADDAVVFGPMGSGKAPGDADRMRAELTAQGASFREETVLRGGREVIEFHVERPEAGR
ncbi:hypothetical protein ACIBBE_23960 [Streptomyces sp. NPDC051644]|uniref:hypothetical protein n=1 Tax=Streptomyces sp. NPDC051644 TaxID=3365666 RepID=UPI0037AC2577